MSKRILFIDDQLEDWEGLLSRGLFPFGFELHGEEDPSSAIKVIGSIRPDAILLDILFGEEFLGKPTLEKIKQKYPHLPVIMITSTMGDVTEYNPKDYLLADYRCAKATLASGDFSDLADQLDRAIEKAHRLALEQEQEDTGLDKYGFIVGKTKAMKDLAAAIEMIAGKDQTVLVTGESGTGKELVARAIHKLSGRDGPFVAINCGAIPENLIESELFGHERGAFTDAIERIGKFEIAGQGTIFLDEISEMPFDTQVKLLRFLQEKKYGKVGGNRELSSNARIIAATNSNLEDMVKKGTFRKDLFYRLDVISLYVSPLRERKEDIPDFFKYFVRKLRSSPSSVLANLRADVEKLLKSYHWPGNVRELENKISRAVALAEESILQVTNFADLAKSGNSDQYIPADVDEIVDRIFKDELTWEQIRTEFGAKGNMRREIVFGVAERWWNEHGRRPKSKDLANLLSISKDGTMRQILNECDIKLTQIEKQ